MIELPLPRVGLPGLEPLLNGDLWARWEAEGKVFPVPDFRRCVRYVRLKPGTSCRLAVFSGLEETAPGRPPVGMLLYLFPTVDRAQEFFVKRSSGKLWSKQVAHDPFIDTRQAIVALPFPNDREIPALRHVYRHHRLKELVLSYLPGLVPTGWKISKHATRLQLIRYKAGRRAVFQYTLATEHAATGERRSTLLHLKAESPDTFSPSRNAFLGRLSLALESTGVGIPGILGVDSVRLLTIRPWYSGWDLAGCMNDRGGLQQAGRALAALHHVPPRLSMPATDDPVDAAISETEGLTALLPEEGARIRRVGDRIVDGLLRLSARNPVLLHGDFHPEQVLFHNGGVVLIDLDRCGAGHAAIDLGNFLAHAAESRLNDTRRLAFLEAYRSASDRDIDPRGLVTGYCLGLLRRCGRPFRDLDSNWPDRVQGRLARLEHACEDLG